METEYFSKFGFQLTFVSKGVDRGKFRTKEKRRDEFFDKKTGDRKQYVPWAVISFQENPRG